MAGPKYGIAGLSSNALSSPVKYSNSLPPEIFYLRVKDIILDSSHPQFKENGEWASIGLVFAQDIANNNNNIENGGNIDEPNSGLVKVKPLFPNLKHYPLINEIIPIHKFPQINSGLIRGETLYYTVPLNIWASQHHNAIPAGIGDGGNPNLPPSQEKDYQQTQGGSVRKVTDGDTEINLGKTFIEQLDINPLQPYEGDYIIEGRFGQSLRFGSSEGKDPITKIRNGQGIKTSEGWTTTNESINQDKASIYLTSTQQVDLEPNIFNYNSYNTAPESIANYSSNQVVINSGRLVLNSNIDSVLLSSAKSINLNSQDSVNIDSKNTFVINSPSILLGDKNATESILKGDVTIELLSELVDELRKWMTQFNTNPSPYLAPLKVSTTPLISTLVKLKTNLETKTKSKVSKTI